MRITVFLREQSPSHQFCVSSFYLLYTYIHVHTVTVLVFLQRYKYHGRLICLKLSDVCLFNLPISYKKSPIKTELNSS